MLVPAVLVLFRIAVVSLMKFISIGLSVCVS